MLKSRFQSIGRICFRIVAAAAWLLASEVLRAQANPAPQSLPYSQDFGSASFTALPAGVAAWNGLSGSTVSSSTIAAASSPTGDAGVSGAVAAQTTGGCYGLASGGNGRFYIQTSSSTTNGANQLVIAVSTEGWNSVTLRYDVEIVSAQPRTVGALCQFRVGTTGGWTTLLPASGANPFSQAGGTVGVKTSPQFVLPGVAENQPVVQIRWAIWRGTESGNSSGVAIDNILVGGSSSTSVLSASLSASSVGEDAGANASTLTVTRTGDLAGALPVTLVISDPTEAAYDGPNPLSIPAGQASVTFPIRAVDDDGNDGTQTVTLQVTAPGAVSASAALAVLDNEDVFSPPIGHYSAAVGLRGTALKAALKAIASPGNYRVYAYADVYGPLRAIWEDPNNSANLITVYSGTSLPKNASYFPGGPSADESWSREHIWPDSFGLDPDNVNPGGTGGDAGPDFTDLFNLRPCLQTVNATRGNYYYDETSGTPIVPPLAPLCSRDGDSWEPREEEKGDLARTIFYMATRYDGTDPNTLDLEIGNTPSTPLARFANLAMLLRWNDEHPVSPGERQRNQTIFTTYQRNRNPFIDHPEYINRIWGNVRLEKLEATVSEGGAFETYSISLGAEPEATVNIALSTTANGQLSVSPANLTFTAANWDQPQVIVLSAVDDSIHEPTQSVRVLHSVTSSDARYAALIPLDLQVAILDDDPVIAPAALPINYGGPWDALPMGFLGNGLGSPYAGSLGGDGAPGSAKFDSTGDQLTIAFTSSPALLTYQLKGNPSTGGATGGTFLVRQSVDGVNFTTVRTILNKDNTDQAFTDGLAQASRFVSFVYSEKVSGNVQLDKLTITAAPSSLYSSWASTYGLTGDDALPMADPESDGYANLLDYTFGGSPVASDRVVIQPTIQSLPGVFRMTAVIRTSDAALTVIPEMTSDPRSPSSWSSAGFMPVSNVNQTGVPPGFVRLAYDVPTTGSSFFFRFRVELD